MCIRDRLNEIGRGTDGKSIYIYGAAGGVGTAVIQTALLQGIEVIASASSQEKCDYIKSLGAQCAVSYTHLDVYKRQAVVYNTICCNR